MTEVKKTFPIEGMHCATCVRVLEKSLSKVAGVSDCTVNLATETATVTYDPKKVTDNDLVSAVANAGYKASLPVNTGKAELEQELKTEDEQRHEKQKELNSLRNKVIISLFLGALILWGSFPGLMEFAPSFLQSFGCNLF